MLQRVILNVVSDELILLKENNYSTVEGKRAVNVIAAVHNKSSKLCNAYVNAALKNDSEWFFCFVISGSNSR